MHTLSYLCSLLRLAKPPQRSELPRTKRRFERMEPSRDNFTTWTLFWWSANNAMIISVAFPHVAFRSPPTKLTSTQTKTKLVNFLYHVIICKVILSAYNEVSFYSTCWAGEICNLPWSFWVIRIIKKRS